MKLHQNSFMRSIKPPSESVKVDIERLQYVHESNNCDWNVAICSWVELLLCWYLCLFWVCWVIPMVWAEVPNLPMPISFSQYHKVQWTVSKATLMVQSWIKTVASHAIRVQCWCNACTEVLFWLQLFCGMTNLCLPTPMTVAINFPRQWAVGRL